jgi:hypothetical protein
MHSPRSHGRLRSGLSSNFWLDRTSLGLTGLVTLVIVLLNVVMPLDVRDGRQLTWRTRAGDLWSLAVHNVPAAAPALFTFPVLLILLLLGAVSFALVIVATARLSR